MKNKIFTILGILLIVVSIGAYFLFDANVKQHSQTMGVNLLVAKTNIPEGTIIESTSQARGYFDVKRMSQIDAVPNSISVKVIETEDSGFIDKIKKYFVSETFQIAESELKTLVNKRIITDIYKNQQILSLYLSDNIVEFENDERLFAVPTSYIDSVGAEIAKDDYVDLWIHYDKGGNKHGVSEKVIESLKVNKVKSANNIESKPEEGNLPVLVVFKMSEDQITLVSERMHEGTLFLTKWGKKPENTTPRVIESNYKSEITITENLPEINETENGESEEEIKEDETVEKITGNEEGETGTTETNR